MTSEKTWAAVAGVYEGFGEDSKLSSSERYERLCGFVKKVDGLLEEHTNIHRGSLMDLLGSINCYFSNDKYWSYRFSDEDHKVFMSFDHTFAKKVCEKLQKRLASP